MKKLIFFAVILFSLFSCQENAMNAESYAMPEMMEDYEGNYDEPQSKSTMTSGNGGGNQSLEERDQAPIERKIIKTANYSMEVKNVEESAQRVETYVRQVGANITSSNLNSSGRYIRNDITIRVPAEKLDTLLTIIKQEAIDINYKNISSTDVTEEFLDVETRLKTKKIVRDRYVELLRNKAKTVEEILNAEERIRVIQEEIESKEGRLRYLKNQSALSTVHLEIYQTDGKGIVKASFFSKIGQAFANGWDGLKEFVLIAINLWPFIIMLLVIFYFFSKWKGGRKTT